MKIERRWFHFLRDFFAAVAVLVIVLPGLITSFISISEVKRKKRSRTCFPFFRMYKKTCCQIENKRWNVWACSKTTLQTTLRTPARGQGGEKTSFSEKWHSRKSATWLALDNFLRLDFRRARFFAAIWHCCFDRLRYRITLSFITQNRCLLLKPLYPSFYIFFLLFRRKVLAVWY